MTHGHLVGGTNRSVTAAIAADLAGAPPQVRRNSLPLGSHFEVCGFPLRPKRLVGCIR